MPMYKVLDYIFQFLKWIKYTIFTQNKTKKNNTYINTHFPYCRRIEKSLRCQFNFLSFRLFFHFLLHEKWDSIVVVVGKMFLCFVFLYFDVCVYMCILTHIVGDGEMAISWPDLIIYIIYIHKKFECFLRILFVGAKNKRKKTKLTKKGMKGNRCAQHC